MSDIKRNLEANGGLYISRWWTGLIDNRSPLFTPISAMGLQMIARQDALIDGLNIEISPRMTLQRRFGFLRYCSTAFGSSDYPLSYYSFRNLSGTVYALVDTSTHVYHFTTSAITSVFSKSSTAAGSFAKVADTLYYADGNDADLKKWDGSTATAFGIAFPVTAPTVSPSGGSLSPTVGYTYVYVYRNPTTGAISTASPVSGNTGPQTSQNFTIQGASSSDAQVTKVDIYRTFDGGSVYYFLATVNNGGTWSYTDSTADANLNSDIVAPLAGANNPPPTGTSLLVWHMGRLWAASGNVLYFSAGPDCTNGVGAEAWPPANNFPVPGAIKALASTSQGLVVFTDDDAYMVLGQDSSSFTVPQLWQQNFGVNSQFNIAQDGDLLFIFTNKAQLFQIQVGSALQEIGFSVSTHLAAMTPANVHLALHRSGTDEGLFVSDGSTNLLRFSIAMSCWCPVAQPVGGCSALKSMEVTAGNWRLMMGRSAGSGYILDRDTSTFTDDGSTFTGFATIGSLTVAPPRQVANIASVLLQMTAAGTYPTVSVLLNEISGTFTTLPNPVPDPPQLAASKTVRMMRHDFKAAQTPLSGHVQNMQVRVSFIAEAAQNELLGLGLA